MRHNLKHLSTFVAVAEELNFHRAAERLRMAQPAVSRIVLELEETGSGSSCWSAPRARVRLTESGRYLLEEAQEILAASTRRRTRCGCSPRAPRRSCASATPRSTGHSLVPDIAREFRLSNPEVRLELTYLHLARRSATSILQDEIDLGFIEGSFQSSEIESRPVARHRLVALLPPSHPLAAKAALTVDELAREQPGDGHQRRVADLPPHRGRYVPARRPGAVRWRRRHRASPASSAWSPPASASPSSPACRASAASMRIVARPIVTDHP